MKLLHTICLGLCAALWSVGAHAERIDGIAARVGRLVVTLSEVEFEARIVLVRRGGERGISAKIDQRLRRTVLDFVVVQTLLETEARRRGGISVSESDVDKGIALLKSRFQSSLAMGTDQAYGRFLKIAFVDDEDIRSVIRRDLRVQELLKQILPVSSALSEKDVAMYVAAHPELLGDEAERKRKAQTTLFKKMQADAFSAFVDELRLRVEVRIIERFVDAKPAKKAGDASATDPTRMQTQP